MACQATKFHFRPQHLNLDYPNLIYDAVFYLESLAVFSDFCCKIAPEVALERSSPHSRGAGSRSKLREHYSERAIELVQNIYAKDFKLFGYSSDLDKTDRVPGQCIVTNRVVPVGTDIDSAFGEEPVNATAHQVYETTVRYHRLVELLTL